MSKDNQNKVVKFDHNYKNRSPIQELVEQNAYLQDALKGAVKVIYKYTINATNLLCNLNDLNDAKNNWDRSKHADAALKNVHTFKRDLKPFKKVLEPLRNNADLYSPINKSNTLELGAQHGNFGMYHANTAKELHEAIMEAEKEWRKETFDNE